MTLDAFGLKQIKHVLISYSLCCGEERCIQGELFKHPARHSEVGEENYLSNSLCFHFCSSLQQRLFLVSSLSARLFPQKCTLRRHDVRKRHYCNILYWWCGYSASDYCFFFLRNRTTSWTTQIWLTLRHQYGICGGSSDYSVTSRVHSVIGDLRVCTTILERDWIRLGS